MGQDDTTMANADDSSAAEMHVHGDMPKESLSSDDVQTHGAPTHGAPTNTTGRNYNDPEHTANDMLESNQSDVSVPVATDALDCPP